MLTIDGTIKHNGIVYGNVKLDSAIDSDMG